MVLALVLLAACTSPSAPAQPTPAPVPTPIPPAPSPPPEPPEVPHYEMMLLSFNGVVAGEGTGRTQLYFSGEIRNDSKEELAGVEVVITAYNTNNEIVAIDKWHTSYWVIEPRQVQQFSLAVTDYSAAVRYEVSFELFELGIIDLSVKRGVSTEFFR
jgi:hypothetical protein